MSLTLGRIGSNWVMKDGKFVNCACCDLVCSQIANESQPRLLHARVRIGAFVTFLPDVAWNPLGGTAGSWQWVAGVPDDTILIANSAIANREDQIDVFDSAELTCGVAGGFPIILPAAGISFRNSVGTYFPVSSTDLASIYDPGPGSFLITYNYGDSADYGFTFTHSDIELEFYDDAYLP